MNKSKSNRSGTKEWAVKNLNIQLGCEHNCRYCYARFNAVDRFHRCTAGQWTNPVISQKKVSINYGKIKNDGSYEYDCMFPSAHDITTGNLSQSLKVLTRLLAAGNHVLIVSKPHIDCITTICDELRDYRHLINFRFSIGSISNEILEFWEPGAPSLLERLTCLRYAKAAGFTTSVSCEPYLDSYIPQLYETCSDYITESFWIGRMRDFQQRVNIKSVTEEQKKKFVNPLIKILNDDFVEFIYQTMKDLPLVRWKDSIRKVISD